MEPHNIDTCRLNIFIVVHGLEIMECEKNFLGKHLYLIEEQWPTWHFKLGHFKSGLSQTTCLILKL